MRPAESHMQQAMEVLNVSLVKIVVYVVGMHLKQFQHGYMQHLISYLKAKVLQQKQLLNRARAELALRMDQQAYVVSSSVGYLTC